MGEVRNNEGRANFFDQHGTAISVGQHTLSHVDATLGTADQEPRSRLEAMSPLHTEQSEPAVTPMTPGHAKLGVPPQRRPQDRWPNHNT